MWLSVEALGSTPRMLHCPKKEITKRGWGSSRPSTGFKAGHVLALGRQLNTEEEVPARDSQTPVPSKTGCPVAATGGRAGFPKRWSVRPWTKKRAHALRKWTKPGRAGTAETTRPHAQGRRGPQPPPRLHAGVGGGDGAGTGPGRGGARQCVRAGERGGAGSGSWQPGAARGLPRSGSPWAARTAASPSPSRCWAR